MERSDSASPIARGLLVVGLLALTGAIVTAHRAPASGYEVSLYAATPSSVWLLLGCSMAVSVVVALWTPNVWTRRLGLGLGGGTTLTIVSLPIIRGYWFVSGGDALTHLGWARAMESGGFHPAELHYPGMHLVSIMFGDAAGIELQQAMMLVIVGLFGLFVVFVALSTGVVIDRPHATTMGAFGAFLLLPITNLSMFVTPHAMSQAVLFSAVVIYLTLTYIRKNTSDQIFTPEGVLLAISLVAIVVYHPQLAAHMLGLFVGICALQFVVRRQWTNHPISHHRLFFNQTVLLGVAFLIWTANHDFIQNVIQFHLTSTIEFFIGDATSGESVESKGDSLTEIGGSFFELFLKLLGPAITLGLLTTILLGWLYVGDNGRLDRATNGFLHYFTVFLIGLAGIFAIYFFGSSGEMYFRVLGFSWLFVTISAGAAVTYVFCNHSVGRNRFGTGTVIAVLFCLLFVMSIVALFPSPYIYLSSPHVSEQSMSGHETTLISVPEDQPIDGIRAGPNRYADAAEGDLDRIRIHGYVDAEEIDEGLVRSGEQNQYVTVGQPDIDREVISYHELRYSESQLDSISRQHGVNQVANNGEFSLYFVSGDE